MWHGGLKAFKLSTGFIIFISESFQHETQSTGSRLLALESVAAWLELLVADSVSNTVWKPAVMGGTPLMETWTLFWHELIFSIQRIRSRQLGTPRRIKQLCGDFGSHPCAIEAREISELCSIQSLHRQVLLITFTDLNLSNQHRWNKHVTTVRLKEFSS